MLSENDMDRLLELLGVTAEVIGDQMRPTASVMMAEELGSYPLPVVERALASCRRELKGRLSLAAILERIDDGHPSPNEAWALASPAADERNTVVWTREMEQAWAVALPLIDGGDKIGARMAFLETYTRLLKDAKAERRPAVYAPSLGFDPAGRDAALREAMARGLLTDQQTAGHLRITGPVQPAMQERFTALAKELREGAQERDRQEELSGQVERAELEATRQRELAKLEGWMAERGGAQP